MSGIPLYCPSSVAAMKEDKHEEHTYKEVFVLIIFVPGLLWNRPFFFKYKKAAIIFKSPDYKVTWIVL